jgi:hypothetical protein
MRRTGRARRRRNGPQRGDRCRARPLHNDLDATDGFHGPCRTGRAVDPGSNIMMKIWDVLKRVGFGANALLVGVAMSACATDGDVADEAAVQPIAEVTLPNSSVVSFYEPSPGAISISERTKIDVAPIATQGKSAVEIYRSIAPDQPVPEALVAAQVRSEEARRNQPTRELPPPPAKGGIESFSASWFDATYCQVPGYFNRHCHLGTDENGVTVELDGTHYDINEFYTAACVNSGKIQYRVWEDGDNHLDVQLYGGDCEWFHHTTGLFNDDSFRVRTDILSASANYFLSVLWNN